MFWEWSHLNQVAIVRSLLVRLLEDYAVVDQKVL